MPPFMTEFPHPKSRLHRLFYRRGTRLLFIWLVCLAAVGLYVVCMSGWQSYSERWTRFDDLIVFRCVDVLIASWFFFIGSSIGSFLNVVAWRMPRGVSVNGRSHCPRCNQTLSWKDNWPVFGWLALGGRCRTCRMSISPRYPIVELAVGLTILFVGWREFYGCGSTLPFHDKGLGRVGALWTPYMTQENIVTMLYHAVAVAAAWAFALVRFDDHRLPRALVFSVLGLVIVPILVSPGVAVVPWQVAMSPNWQADGRYLDATMRVITGVAAATLIGRALARYLSPMADPKIDPLGKDTARLMDMIAMLIVPAVVVGWQAALGVTIVAVLIAYALPVAVPSCPDALSRLGIGLVIALTLQLCCWRLLHNLGFFWPTIGSPPYVILAWAAAILIVPRILLQPANSTSPVDFANPDSDDDQQSTDEPFV